MGMAKRRVKGHTSSIVDSTSAGCVHWRGTLALPILGAMLAPAGLVHADSIDSTSAILRFFENVKLILDVLIPLLVTLAVLVFFWGMVKFLWSGADEKARESGKGLMIWGIIALFVMISVWGLVQLFGSLFGINQNATITVPAVPSSGGLGGGGSI